MVREPQVGGPVAAVLLDMALGMETQSAKVGQVPDRRSQLRAEAQVGTQRDLPLRVKGTEQVPDQLPGMRQAVVRQHQHLPQAPLTDHLQDRVPMVSISAGVGDLWRLIFPERGHLFLITHRVHKT